MSAFALDPLYNDFLFTGGRLSLLTGIQECAQKLNARFGFNRGEWFLDTQQGTPWTAAILGLKNPSLPALTNLARKIILATPGVLQVLTIQLAFDKANRKITFSNVQIKHNSGAIITGGPGTPFIVPLSNLSATPSGAT